MQRYRYYVTISVAVYRNLFACALNALNPMRIVALLPAKMQRRQQAPPLLWQLVAAAPLDVGVRPCYEWGRWDKQGESVSQTPKCPQLLAACM